MTLDKLIDQYCKVANRLSEYKRSHGFEPGARVECRFGNQPMKTGEIAPFGEMWSTIDHMSVPVILDDSDRMQPWMISHLKVIKK